MAANDLIDSEAKLSNKFKRLLEEYDINLLFDIPEIEAGVNEIKGVIDKYEDIHVELKREMGDGYIEAYPNDLEKLKPMTDWIKSAKLEIKNRKILREKEDKEKEKEEEQRRIDKEEREKMAKEVEKADQQRREEEFRERGVRKEKERLRTAQKHLDRRIELTLMSIKRENSVFVEDMDRNICCIRELMKEHSELFIKIEDVFGEDFEKDFSIIFKTQNDAMYDSLCDLMDLSQSTKHEKLKKMQN